MANPQVVLHSNKGDIVIELDVDKAPNTVENFLRYVDEGFFDGTIFHRVIPGFMIQGGGFYGGHAAESRPCAHRQRGGEWSEKCAGHSRHGADQ